MNEIIEILPVRCNIRDHNCTCTLAQLAQDYEFMSPPRFSSLCIGIPSGVSDSRLPRGAQPVHHPLRVRVWPGHVHLRGQECGGQGLRGCISPGGSIPQHSHRVSLPGTRQKSPVVAKEWVCFVFFFCLWDLSWTLILAICI